MNKRHDIDKLAQEATNQPPPFPYKEEHWEKAVGVLTQGAVAGSSGIGKWVGWSLLALLGLVGGGIAYFLTQSHGNPAQGRPAKQEILASATNINLAVATGQVNLLQVNNSVNNPASISELSEQEVYLEYEGIKERSQIEGGNGSNIVHNPAQNTGNKKSTGSKERPMPESEVAILTNQKTIEQEQRSSESSGSETLLDEMEEDGPVMTTSESTDESMEQTPREELDRQASFRENMLPNLSPPSSQPALSWFTLDPLEGNNITQNEVQLPPIYPEYDPDEVIRNKYLSAKWGIWLEAGARFTATWDSSSQPALDPYLGVGVTYKVSPRLLVSSGISAFMRGHEALPRGYSVRDFGFGVEHRHYGQELSAIYYTQLPLSIQYRFHPRHEVGLGGHLSYMVTTYSTAFENWPPEVVATEEEFAGYHYLDGLRRLNGGLHVNYNYLLNDLWSIWMQMDYGLGSELIPDYYNTDQPGRNHGFTVGIRHHLK